MTNSNNIGSNSIPFRLIKQNEEANKLVIVLPGAGYTTQAPLLHFTTGLFFKKGFDVLHINYSFSREEMSVMNDIDFARDVRLAVDKALTGKRYSIIYVVAKSIGTKALSYLLDHAQLKDAKTVWLTPLLQNDHVFDAMVTVENKGLCIIGDHDPCFIAERVEKLKNNQNLILKVVAGGNHSLELDKEPIKSIELLKSVISAIDDF